MLPNFLIIGTQKAATTWLARCLGEHPDVFMSEPKELYFFTHLEKGLNWYKAHFNECSGEAAVGEASPGYIIHPEVPERIKAILGNDVKIIVSLRHPVDRAYSAFGHFRREGTVPAGADFRSLFLQDDLKLRSRGYYYTDLKHYLTLFNRKQVLVLIYDEVNADNHKAMIDCFRFLEVDPQFVPKSLNARVNKGADQRIFHSQMDALRRQVAAKTKLLAPSLREPALKVGRRIYHNLILGLLPTQTRYEPLSPELRHELLQDFMPDIRQLESLLDRDLSIWYAPIHK